jgi:exodeoxyribonuclease V gamma subunit
LAGVSPADAKVHLGDLVEVYRAGMGIPLPLPPKAAAVYAAKRGAGVPVPVAETQAGQEWRKGGAGYEMGEFNDADHRRVWGGDVHLSTLLEVPRVSADTRWPDEPHRFGQLARAVWTPLLDAETVV